MRIKDIHPREILGKVKNFFKHFFLINDTPHKVAAGAALGIFLGIVPGEGLAATLILASLFRLNRLAATAGVLATNMWMTLLVMPPAASIGGFLFGTDQQSLIEDFDRTFDLGWHFFLSKTVLFEIALPLVAGFFILAGAIAIAFYFLLLYLLTHHKIEFSKNHVE